MILFSQITSNLQKELGLISSLLDQTIVKEHSSVFEITVNEIHQLSNGTIKNKIKDFFGDFFSPVIYYFEIQGCNDISKLKTCFCKAKKCKHENRAFSKPNNISNGGSVILYVGSSGSKNIVKRIYDHFGVGSIRIYAMHLKAWIPPNKEWTIKVHVLVPIIPKNNLTHFKILEVIEQGYWNHYQPLLGKRSGLL